MKKNKENLLIVLSVLLFSCTGNNINKPTTQSPVPSQAISATPSTVPSASQSSPVQTPSPIVSAPVVSPTPLPVPTNPTKDISDLATLNGKVYDEQGNSLNDIKVSIKSLDENVVLNEETTTSNGTYVFRNIPVGIRLQVDVFKSDTWTKKSQSIVLKSNLNGVTGFNVLDFGDIYNVEDSKKTNFFFITDAPEVVSITPTKYANIKHFGFSVKMVFSEPVKKDSVEKNFIMRYIKSDISPTTAPGDGTNGTDNTDGPPLILGNSQIIIARNTVSSSITWDAASTGDMGREFTFTINENRGIPTTNKTRVLYSISLRDRDGSVKLQDAEGNNGLDFGEFFLDGRRAKNIVVNVEADKTQPYISELKLLKTSNNAIIRVTFSEPMTVQNVDNPDLTDPEFYTFYKNGSEIELEDPLFSLAAPGTIEILTNKNTFGTNDKIKVEINPNLKDPAGNFFSQGVTSGERDNILESTFKPD
jgi:hypothetical protein